MIVLQKLFLDEAFFNCKAILNIILILARLTPFKKIWFLELIPSLEQKDEPFCI
jgi:hypothetical protein